MSDQTKLLPLYRQAIDHLKKAENKSLTSIAQETGISRNYLSQVYHAKGDRTVTGRLIHTLNSVYGIQIDSPDGQIKITDASHPSPSTFKLITEVIMVQGKVISTESRIEPII